MKSLQYLDLAKEVTGITSDYGMAKVLGINRATISQWRSGKMFMDDYTCLRLAQMLSRDPLEVIAAVNAEREKDGAKREVWANLFLTVTQPLAAAITGKTKAARMQKAPAGVPAEALKQWRKGGDSNPR
ncbi:MAG: hypothetical protein JNM11_06755 [Chitinimonas sp.]|nr:hypothetical protein [Chitinimonas sp.]